MVVDDLLAQLKTVSGIAAVYDSGLPDGYVPARAPVLVVSHISTVPDVPIDDSILGYEDRWQVSVIGGNPANVRTAVSGVIAALHSFSGETISRCEFDSQPGTFRDGTNPVQYHAPVDFLVYY